MVYDEESFLMLSGIQHYAFCKRQWALIHVENQWSENYSTAHGNVVHKNAHDKAFQETRGNLFITRGMNVFSSILGISGECDVVEFHKNENGISLHGKQDAYLPFPIEYKSGKPKEYNADALQLCAQAMCLEEMLCCEIQEGAIYYDAIKRRESVLFTEELRKTVVRYFDEMHRLHKKGHTPQVKSQKKCTNCSLKNICVPKILKQQSALEYMTKSIED
ncbi:MAG: CRISPR-associated protein Cas4 [Bacillota bacterium]